MSGSQAWGVRHLATSAVPLEADGVEQTNLMWINSDANDMYEVIAQCGHGRVVARPGDAGAPPDLYLARPPWQAGRAHDASCPELIWVIIGLAGPTHGKTLPVPQLSVTQLRENAEPATANPWQKGEGL